MNEETKSKTQPGPSGLQREASSEEEKVRRQLKAIREGHLTGGYIETDVLLETEKHLYKILNEKLKQAEATHGTHHRAEFQHPEVRRLKLELNGLAFRPKLVVKD